MDLIFDILVDLVFDLAGKTVKNTKNQKIAAIFTIVVVTTVIGLAIWRGISAYRKDNMLAVIAAAAVVILAVLLVGLLVLRRVIRRKKHERS